MKKFKTLTAVITGVLVSASLFTGCSKDQTDLMSAIQKTKTITSASSKVTLSAKVTAENQSAEEQKETKDFFDIINGSDISMTSQFQKKTQGSDSSMQSKLDVVVNSQGDSMEVPIWANNSTTNGKTTENEIVKIPGMFKTTMPEEFANKPYMTVSTEDLANMQGGENAKEEQKIQQFSQETQKKLAAFAQAFITSYDPGVDLVTYKGEQNGLKQYELKLDNTQLKSILLYTAKALGTNSQTAVLLKGIVKDYISIEDISSKEADAQIKEANTEIDKIITDLADSNGKVAKAIGNISILGPKGVDINYSVNSDGYVTSTNGTVQIVVDMQKLISQLDEQQGSDTGMVPELTGKYTIDLSFSNELTGINQPTTITDLPQTNSTNSFTLTQLFKAEQAEAQLNTAKEMTKEAIKSKNVEVINAAILSVKALPNSTEKTSLLKQLDSALKTANKTAATKLISKVKKSLAISDYEDASAAIKKLAKADAAKYSKELNKIQTKVYTKDVVAAQKAINNVKKHKISANIKAAKKAISKIKNKTNRAYLTKKLNSLIK